MRLRTFAFCLAFALPVAPVAAQLTSTPATAPAPAPAPVPDPANLINGWWAFFGDAPQQELVARAESFGERLDALSVSIVGDGEQETKTRALLAEIKALLKVFVDGRVAAQASNTPAPSPPAVAVARSVENLLELSTKRLDLGIEVERTSREVKEQEAAVNAAKQRVGDALAAYIASDAKLPGRLNSGLEIVRLRLFWALGVAELEHLQSARLRLDQEHKATVAQIESSDAALSASDAERQRWSKQLLESKDARERLEIAATQSRLRTTAFTNDAVGQIQRRQLQQQVLDLEVQRSLASLRHAEAELALDLVTAALGTAPELDALRSHQSVLDDAVAATGKQLGVWRRTTEQERGSANERLASDADEKQLVGINRARVQQADSTAKTLATINRQLARGELLSALAKQQIVAQGGQVGHLRAQAGEGLRSLWMQIQTFSTSSLFSINDTPVTALGLLRFTIIVLVAWFVSRLVRKGFEKLIARRENMSRASIYTLSRLFHYLVLTLGFFIAFSSIGIDFTKFALIASAFGVGLGFGLQAIFSNFVAGLIILFERSLKVGDFVELESGVTGEVQSVNIRSTLVTTNDNIDILVPNSEFVNGRVTNWTLREAYRRVRIPFGVAYGTNKDLVKQAALEACGSVSHTLMTTAGREPQVWLVGFGESSLDFELVVWLKPESVKRPGAVNAAYTWALETALSQHGIEIPFPQRDLHVRSAFGHKDEDGPKMLASITTLKQSLRRESDGERIDD